ncbi:M48 family metallopeptidase [Amycolatopsis sp. NPDC051373]|uniref:M48 family metallopeptidase n=1 Tax=Amycolatopsis sp. NPDC051373 TaxID=3155801 RepID=UPI0034507885
MKNSFRAPAAVTLLAGFPVLVLALVAAIVVVEVFAFRNRLSHGLEFAVFAAPATYVLLRALLTFDRAGEAPGLLVTAETQPELRALVRELAETVGTAPPDEVRIMNRVNAAVHERTRWFGLRVTERTLFIGAPLFAGLGVAELRAVLGHEFAHYSSSDTRFAGATYRGRVAILRVLSGLDGASWFSRLLRPLFQVYGWVYFAVSGRVSRDQELAADVAAARVAGTAAATAALREIEALDAVWRVSTRQYLVMGWNAGYLPDRPAEGYRLLLTDETRAQEPARPRQNPPEASPLDNHPRTDERIRVLEAAGVNPMPEVEDRPASELLRDAEEILDAAWFAELSDEGRAKQRTGWETLADVSSRHEFGELAAQVLRGRSVGDLLDALDAGRPADVVDPDLPIPAEADQRTRRELVSESARIRLSFVALSQAAGAGGARWTISWSEVTALRLTPRYSGTLFPAIDAAVAGDTAALRALLSEPGRVPSA